MGQAQSLLVNHRTDQMKVLFLMALDIPYLFNLDVFTEEKFISNLLDKFSATLNTVTDKKTDKVITVFRKKKAISWKYDLAYLREGMPLMLLMKD